MARSILTSLLRCGSDCAGSLGLESLLRKPSSRTGPAANTGVSIPKPTFRGPALSSSVQKAESGPSGE